MLFVKQFPLGPHELQDIASYIGCPAAFYGKSLFLKTQHTFIVEHTDITLELRWKLPPCWLISTVPEDAMQAAGGEKLPMILAAVHSPCYKSSSQTSHSHLLKGGRSPIYQTPPLKKGSHP